MVNGIKKIMELQNGELHSRINEIGEDVHEIKDNLARSVEGLTVAINGLSSKLDNFMIVAQNSLPIKAVFWLLAIMVFGLVGVEGVKALPELIKHFML